MWWGRFEGPWRLLVRALLSGVAGARRALTSYRRLRRAAPEASLRTFVETLCRGEASCPRAEGQTVAVKPLVCMFPVTFQQNLLSFIHLVHTGLPQMTVFHLLECLKQEPHLNAWVAALVSQLERDMGAQRDKPLCTPQCSRRLEELAQRLMDSGGTGGWSQCLHTQKPQAVSQTASGVSDRETQRKRKSSCVCPDSDDESTEQQIKRVKVDFDAHDDCTSPARTQQQISKEIQAESSAEERQPAVESTSDVLPEHIKVAVTQIEELLEGQSEWDESSAKVFKVLNECNPAQVEVLCHMVNMSEVGEQTLPKLCSSILALSPDLSYSTATALIKCILLEKVRSLSEPASRCLVTTSMSLCSRYPRPVCHSLIRPLLEETNLGNPQSELLNRLIESCLDQHYRLLVLQMMCRVSWSEAAFSTVHSLLDSKPEPNEELFSQFIDQLVSQAPQFSQSVKFAKLMLTALTKFMSQINDAHKRALSGCVMSNQTFLKKSLQAALKRITHQ